MVGYWIIKMVSASTGARIFPRDDGAFCRNQQGVFDGERKTAAWMYALRAGECTQSAFYTLQQFEKTRILLL